MMSEDYFSPASLLNQIELTVRRLCTDEGDADPVGTADVLLCGILPDLRTALRSAGLNVPAYGPHSVRRDVAAAEAEDSRATALYHWWDDVDVLLYIGIADRIGKRTQDHAKGSSWMEFAARSTVERFPSRSGALAAEEAAIKAERPVFNKQHNDTPEARRRQVEYLIEHDRLDLLAPAVSRG
jgi:predicted GIY-YIG superfamily endonuclease